MPTLFHIPTTHRLHEVHCQTLFQSSWIVVFVTKTDCNFSSISRKNWLFLILSGLSTGLSWLCYYRAIQAGKVSKVVAVDKFSIILTMIFAAVFLHEQFTVKSTLGCLMIAAGTLLMVLLAGWLHPRREDS